MPSALVDDLLEQVLLRLPPHEPANLIRAALVSRRWRRLASAAGFRRRFREFHGRPPMLGMLCNREDVNVALFVPTAAFCSPEADRGHRRALDARHGRVLLRRKDYALVVWDPITDEEWVLPFPPRYSSTVFWAATVLCAAAAAAAATPAGARSCDHLDCHRRPFVVVFVGCIHYLGQEIFICTYASETAAWTEPICTKQPGYFGGSMTNPLAGSALYFREFGGSRVLKYNLESQEISWILLPLPLHPVKQSVLTTDENGELVLAIVHRSNSKLYIWLRNQDAACKVGDEWKLIKAIELKKLLPADAALSKLDVVGSAEGVGIIFISADDVVYTIDLKTYKTKKVYEGKIDYIVPYMSFYPPALEAAYSGDETSAGGSSA